MADFNPLQNYLGGLGAGQQQVDRQNELDKQSQIKQLSGALSQSSQPMLEPEFQKLVELDPARAKQIIDVAAGGDALRANAMLNDAKKLKHLLNIKDFSGAENLLSNRKRLIQGDSGDTDAVLGMVKNQDYQGAMNAVDSYLGLFDPNASKDKSNNKFAPQTTAPKVDTSTGQIYYTVFDPNTKEATRVDVPNAFAQTPDEVQSGVVSVDTRKQLAKQAIDASTKAFEQLPLIKKSINNIGEAIAAVKSGAGTGPVEQFFPSITQASVTLDNLAGQMGLDVINSATFGALSEKELKFAIDTAIPRGLEGADLTDWLERKRESQQKLARELQKMAVFLGKGNNTVADYLSQEGVNYSQLQDKSGLDTGGSQSSPQPSSGFKILDVK